MSACRLGGATAEPNINNHAAKNLHHITEFGIVSDLDLLQPL